MDPLRRAAPLALLSTLSVAAPACSGGGGATESGASASGEATTAASTTAGDATTTTTSAAATTDATTGPGETTGAPSTPGEDASIPIFVGEHIYFGAENRRQVDVEVALPEDGAYDSIVLNLALGCPNGLCDHWDRYGTIGIVQSPGAEDEGYVELARFITAYRLPAAWALDLTDLRPLLRGTVTMRVFIDTWVGPGHQQGDGWLVDASLDLHGGVPSPEPIAVMPLWYQSFGAGDPESPVDAQVPVREFTPPAGATSYKVRAHITGHGFGNTDNCAEFCPLLHGYLVNGGDGYSAKIWRDDCTETAVPDQYGTWTYPRAGWCPGADVIPWVFDLTPSIQPGEVNTILYALQDYENTCRPGLDSCVGCNAGATCEDGHSLPYYYMSALLIGYR